MKNKQAYLLRVALDESSGHHVHVLPCGAVGNVRALFVVAKTRGFDGHESVFRRRLKKAGGRMAMAELAKPVKKSLATKKKFSQSDEIAAAIKALDARKAAMR